MLSKLSQSTDALCLCCACYLPHCKLCQRSQRAFSTPPANMGTHLSLVAVALQETSCFCCLPNCERCQRPSSMDSASAAALAAPQGKKRPEQKRKKAMIAKWQRRSRRPLRQELEEDSLDDDADGAKAVAHLGNLFSDTSMRHAKRGHRLGVIWHGQRWDFWEIFAGKAQLTEAVASLGCLTGPSVDNQPLSCHGAIVSRLLLDLTDPEDVSFLWWLLTTFLPRYVHVGPPCTFWTPIGRWTKKRTPSEWQALRKVAKQLLRLAVQILRFQAAHGGAGSLEQPPRCCSWHLQDVLALMDLPGWEAFKWPSCVYGLVDPGNLLPYRKEQQFASNIDLSPMGEVRCSCARHQQVHQLVASGPRKGERRTTVAGEYPRAMCNKLAGLICHAQQVQ